jgi:hypothetical protein
MNSVKHMRALSSQQSALVLTDKRNGDEMMMPVECNKLSNTAMGEREAESEVRGDVPPACIRLPFPYQSGPDD